MTQREVGAGIAGAGRQAQQQRKRPRRARVEINCVYTPSTRCAMAPGAHRRAAAGSFQQQPGILRFYAEETPGLKIGPTTYRGRVAFYRSSFTVASMACNLTQRAQVLVMSVMFVGFVVLLHIYGKLTAIAGGGRAPDHARDPGR